MTLPKKPLDSLVDIQKLVKQTSPAIDLARTLASIEAPAKTLRDLGKTLTVNSDLMKSIESASDIARRLMQHSDLAAKLTEGLPKIDLNLPDISTSIKASLPKQLPDFSALPPAPSPVAMPKASPETFVQADFFSTASQIWDAWSVAYESAENSRSRNSQIWQAWDAGLSLNSKTASRRWNLQKFSRSLERPAFPLSRATGHCKWKC